MISPKRCCFAETSPAGYLHKVCAQSKSHKRLPRASPKVYGSAADAAVPSAAGKGIASGQNSSVTAAAPADSSANSLPARQTECKASSVERGGSTDSAKSNRPECLVCLILGDFECALPESMVCGHAFHTFCVQRATETRGITAKEEFPCPV